MSRLCRTWCYLLAVGILFVPTHHSTTPPQAEELHWLPQPNSTSSDYIESLLFANGLNPPSGLFDEYIQPPQVISMPICTERQQLTCNHYIPKPQASSFSQSEGRLTEILAALDGLLLPLTYQMETIAPYKVIIPGFSSAALDKATVSEIEEAATSAGISTSSEIFKTMKRTISDMMGILGSTTSQLVVTPESIFTYVHNLECRFDDPPNALTQLDPQTPPLVAHSFRKGNRILIDPTSAILHTDPVVHKMGSLIRGSVSILYSAYEPDDVDKKNKFKLVIRFTTNFNIKSLTDAKKLSLKPSTLRAATSLESDPFTYHLTIETPLLKGFFVSLLKDTQKPVRSTLLCIEDQAPTGMLRLHQLLQSWTSIKSSLERQNQDTIPNIADETQTISNSNTPDFASIALDFLQSLLVPSKDIIQKKMTGELNKEENNNKSTHVENNAGNTEYDTAIDRHFHHKENQDNETAADGNASDDQTKIELEVIEE